LSKNSHINKENQRLFDRNKSFRRGHNDER
jgi:hypothetical protein